MNTKAKKKAKMGRPPGRVFGTSLNMRLDAETAARLDALAVQVEATGMGRSTVARLCMLLGLGLAERDVRALLAASTKRARRA